MESLVDVIQAKILDALAKTHTSTVGRVVRVGAKTIDIQPVVNMVYRGEDLKLPLLVDVPPVYMQGGSSYTAHPIVVGDYALVVFCERSFDRWYSGTDEVRPPELRMHDLSDGFAFVGINPQSKAIQIPTVITQVGDTHQTGDYVHVGNRTQTGNYTLTGDQLINGNLTVTGNVTVSGAVTSASLSTGAATIGGISFATHRHTGVQTGPGTSGGPV